jgi:hypothetical protein
MANDEKKRNNETLKLMTRNANERLLKDIDDQQLLQRHATASSSHGT